MKKLIFSGFLMLFLFGCYSGKMIQTNYYVLEYFEHLNKAELKKDVPFDYTVWVQDTKIPANYNRKQIVLRHFGPKITYSARDLWGVKLSDIIPDFINKKFIDYNVFKSTQRDLLNEIPDYIIATKITNIEFYRSDYSNQARLVMDFYLKKGDEEKIILQHSVNCDEILSDDSFDNYVLKINDIVLSEIDEFVLKLENYFEKGYIIETEEEIEKKKDITFIPEQTKKIGMGFLYFPALSQTDNEPYYRVIDKNNEIIASARMGESVILKEGTYLVDYGSGSSAQMITKSKVEILPRYKTVIEPDWGCLMIDILDDDRNYAKIRYEIFDAENGMSYGNEFPADEEIGEKRTVWVLRPGLYKITINDEPFNTLKDFSTVLVEKGKLQDLRIVVGLDEENNPTNLIGAGILSGKEILKTSDKWKYFSTIHGNINVNSKNENEKDKQETSITVAAQMENRIIYDVNPFHFSSKNVIDLGTTKRTDTDFRLSIDDFDLKNTFIYYFIKDIGFYSRVNINSHFFSGYEYFTDKQSYKKLDEAGNVVESVSNAEKIKLKPALFPLNLKEGIGLNIRLLNRSNGNLYLRSGLGLGQDFRKDVYFKSSETLNDTLIYNEQISEYKKGIELSLVGNFRLPFNLTYSTDAYVLFPFDKEITKTMEWENIFNLKLYKYISLEYKLKLENKILNNKEYLYNEHSLFLRLTYILK